MKEKDLLAIAESIALPDQVMMEKALRRQERLAKPPGSLGILEDISVRMAGITGRIINNIDKSCVVIMCADNGVAEEENIASCPQTVTMSQTVNFARRKTGVGALAESFGSELLIVDVGIKHKIPEELYDDVPLADTHKIVNRRLRAGTNNIAKGSAMSRAEALQCIAVGIEMATAVKEAGFDIAGVGEMGIGNTTTSSAVLSAITGKGSSNTCGRGAGLTDEGYARKCDIVDRVSQSYRKQGGLVSMLYADERAGSFDGPSVRRKHQGLDREEAVSYMLDILSKMGGFDICAMAGVFIGAAANRMPVVIDGYISAVAAAAAYIIAPKSSGYMFASHKSYEKGYVHAMAVLGLKPFLALNMRLGEGSGCPIAFDIIKGACDVMANMATFEEAEIDDRCFDDIRQGDCY